MADPFGIVGVIGVATQLTQFGVRFGLDWKDAPADAKSFRAELQTLKTVLSETNTNIILNRDFVDAFRGQHSALLSLLDTAAHGTDTQLMVSDCRVELENLIKDLTERLRGHRIGWERLKGAFLAKRTREAVENLHRQCLALNQLVAIDAAALAAGIYREVRKGQKLLQQIHHAQNHALDDIRRHINSREASDERRTILDWLNPIDYAPQQSDFINRRQAGTGQWLLNSTKFKTWVETKKQALFCPGIPGAGKTILTSIVVDDLSSRFTKDESVGIAYIYCNFRRHDEQKAEDLLTSLLKQLAQGRPSLPDVIRSLYDKHKDKRTRLSFDEASQALCTVAAVYSRVFLVVDALDECQTTAGCRAKFLSSVFNLQDKCRANFFATSRFIPEITGKFQDSVSLEIRASEEDVRRYVDEHISELPSFVGRSPDLKEEVTTGIVKAVDGMFLLAQLHLDSLVGKRSPRAVRTALTKLPTGSDAYDHAYEDAMQRIESQLVDQRELAKQILFWIICAKRPLATLELQHALAVEPGDCEFHEDNIPQTEDMVSVCAGLVTVDEESGIIRLVHYTTQEYFKRTQSDWFPNAETDITTTCATYLSFSIFESGFCSSNKDFEERLRSNILYDYAAHNWGHHAREAPNPSPGVLDFLRCDSRVAASGQALLAAKPWPTKLQYSQYVPRNWTGLHLAAYFGVGHTARHLLGSSGGPDSRDSHHRTPLSYTAANGHIEVVKLLLATGQVNADSASHSGRTPLSYAAGEGHEAIVKLLLATGQVNADSPNSPSRTPLSYAAVNGHKAIVELLLATGQVNADSADRLGQTPLSYAAEEGHEAIVKLLLATGQVNADSADRSGQTPLSYAAMNGHKAVVELLLATGQVNVDLADYSKRTPLSYATKSGHRAVVELLLETGQVDISLVDSSGRAPLSYAAEGGYKAIVELLLATGQADVDLKNGPYGQTPLSHAAEEGHEAIVKLLLATGQVNADSADNSGRTPLSYAAAKGYKAIVGLLLATGQVNVNSKACDNHHQTPLCYAAENGHEAVVELLLATGQVDVDLKDGSHGQTPLSYAAEQGHRAIVKLLLATGQVNADSADRFGRTPLSYAAEEGHEAIVKLLLATGQVNVDSKDCGKLGWTPLRYAAENGHTATVKLLQRRT